MIFYDIITLPYEDRYDDKAQARAVIRQYDQVKEHYLDGVLIDCFNDEEANNIKKEIKKLRPEIKVYVQYRFTKQSPDNTLKSDHNLES